VLYLFLIRNWIACANIVNIILRVLYFDVLEKNNSENQHDLKPAEKKKTQKLNTICTRLCKKTKVLRDGLVDNYSDVVHSHQIFQMFLSRILYLLPYPTPIYTPATPTTQAGYLETSQSYFTVIIYIQILMTGTGSYIRFYNRQNSLFCREHCDWYQLTWIISSAWKLKSCFLKLVRKSGSASLYGHVTFSNPDFGFLMSYVWSHLLSS